MAFDPESHRSAGRRSGVGWRSECQNQTKLTGRVTKRAKLIILAAVWPRLPWECSVMIPAAIMLRGTTTGPAGGSSTSTDRRILRRLLGNPRLRPCRRRWKANGTDFAMRANSFLKRRLIDASLPGYLRPSRLRRIDQPSLCDESEFIPKETVDRCVATLNAAGSQVAAIIGLSAFTDHTCPRCGKTGHFKIHFLGRLGHPGACGWEGYMNTGSYIGHQIAQIFHTGARAAGAMQDEADRKGKERNWMHSVLGFLVVAIFRAASAVVLIPLHCVAALSQPGQTRADIAPRVITLVVFLTGIGVGIYALQRASRPQFPISQQYAPQQQVYTPPQAPTIQFTPGSGSSPTAQQQNRDSVVAATSRLIEAIDRHDLVAARSALDQGADPNMTCAEAGRAQAACGDTETPLHFSVVPDRLVGPPEPGQFPTGIDMIRLLLEHGADPNRRGGFPGHGTTTAFRHVILWTDTNYGAGYPSPAIISLMLAHGADPTLDNPMQDVLACANKPGQYPEVAKSCSELLDLLRGQSAGVRQMPQMQSVIKPSFDCAKASTAVELLI